MLSAKLNTPPQDVTSLALSATSVCLFHGGMISEQTATIKLKGAWNLDSTRSSTNFHFPLMPPALFARFHKVHNKVITSMKTYFSFYMLLYQASDITTFTYSYDFTKYWYLNHVHIFYNFIFGRTDLISWQLTNKGKKIWNKYQIRLHRWFGPIVLYK